MNNRNLSIKSIIAEKIIEEWKTRNKNGILILSYDEFTRLVGKDPRLHLNFDNINAIPDEYLESGLIPLVLERRRTVIIMKNELYYNCDHHTDCKLHYIKDNSCPERKAYYDKKPNISEAEQYNRVLNLEILEYIFNNDWFSSIESKLSIKNKHKLSVPCLNNTYEKLTYGPVDIELDKSFDNDKLKMFCNIELKKEIRDSFYIMQLYNPILAISDIKEWLEPGVSLYFMMEGNVFYIMAFTFDDITNPASIRHLETIGFTTDKNKASLFDYYSKDGKKLDFNEAPFVDRLISSDTKKDTHQEIKPHNEKITIESKRKGDIKGQMSLFDIM